MTSASPLTENNRLVMREPPEGQPLMHQTWGKLLFIHWPIEPHFLRPLIPVQLEIDIFHGSAWIAIAPFTMWDIRALPPLLPPVPGLSSAHELNVRTYVYLNNEPGVWFFSLDCNSAAAVMAARMFYHLPYYNADIELDEDGAGISYNLKRTDKPAARFTGSWNPGAHMSRSEPGSIEFFLTERYCLYAEHHDSIYQARIHHQPWPLQKAELTSLDSTMIEAAGLSVPKGDPLPHYCEKLDVNIWGIQKVA